MIKLDPKDRPLHLAERNRPVGIVIAMILVLVVALGASIFYWQMSSKYTDRTSFNYNVVLKQLNILPLPSTVMLQPRVYNRLDQLSREPCYQDAIVELSDALLDAGYPRESATSLLAFAKRCGITNNEELLTRAYSSLKKWGILRLPFRSQINWSMQIQRMHRTAILGVPHTNNSAFILRH
jgi:hypothetical protein